MIGQCQVKSMRPNHRPISANYRRALVPLVFPSPSFRDNAYTTSTKFLYLWTPHPLSKFSSRLVEVFFWFTLQRSRNLICLWGTPSPSHCGRHISMFPHVGDLLILGSNRRIPRDDHDDGDDIDEFLFSSISPLFEGGAVPDFHSIGSLAPF